MSISKSDVKDLDFIDASELASTNQNNFRSGDSVESTTSSTKTIVFSVGTLLINGDLPTEAGDNVILSGTTGADGTYIVASVVDDVTITVSESINDSTGGSAAFKYPSGASKVGYDNTISSLSAEDIQDAIDEIATTGINAEAHRVLDQLTHELDENYYEEYTYNGPRISNITVWTDSSKTLKIREYDYTYNGPLINTEIIKQYNSSESLIETLTSTYIYNGARISNITTIRTTS